MDVTVLNLVHSVLAVAADLGFSEVMGCLMLLKIRNATDKPLKTKS